MRVPCPCCGSAIPGVSEDTQKRYKRAMETCKRLSHWWDIAKPVIMDGEAAHELAGIVMVGRSAVGLLMKKR